MKSLKPLIPRTLYSYHGAVTILRIPQGTPKDVADTAKNQMRLMAEYEPISPTKKRNSRKIKGQVSLF